jgi:hypothetical protein
MAPEFDEKVNFKLFRGRVGGKKGCFQRNGKTRSYEGDWSGKGHGELLMLENALGLWAGLGQEGPTPANPENRPQGLP